MTIQPGGLPASALRLAFEREVSAARGRPAPSPHEPLVAAFDGPRRALRCALGIIGGAAPPGGVRAGVHVGECDMTRAAGPIFELSAALARAAGPGEVLVSRTIVDLVPGSGIEFVERGSLAGHGLAPDLPMLAIRTA